MHRYTLFIYGFQTTFRVWPLGFVPLPHENELYNSARTASKPALTGITPDEFHLSSPWPALTKATWFSKAFWPGTALKRFVYLGHSVKDLFLFLVTQQNHEVSAKLIVWNQKLPFQRLENCRKITGLLVLALHGHNLELEYLLKQCVLTKRQILRTRRLHNLSKDGVHAIVLESLKYLYTLLDCLKVVPLEYNRETIQLHERNFTRHRHEMILQAPLSL